MQIVAYGLNGLLAALAGVIFASQIGFIPNTAGTGMEMRAIASSVLGGVSLSGRNRNGARRGARRLLHDLDRQHSRAAAPLRPTVNDIIAGAILLVVLITDGKIREAVDRLLRYQKYRKFIDPQAAAQHGDCSLKAATRPLKTALETSEARK